MASAFTETGAMARARDALFDACRAAHRLAESMERLEAVYAKQRGPVGQEYFYVPSDNKGRELDPDWKDRVPIAERGRRREAIDATLKLRAVIDAAIIAVVDVGDTMDSLNESVDRRWTSRAVGDLRRLRGAILRGHDRNVDLSALPMIREGVPKALRGDSSRVAARMEEVKSAILAGVRPREEVVTLSIDVVRRLESAAATVIEHQGGRIQGSTPTSDRSTDPNDAGFRPARWFPKELAARLRMAAQPGRKTKRVASRKIDRIVFYSVADARKWWPDAFQKRP